MLENGLEISTRASVSVGGPLPVRNEDCIPYEDLKVLSSRRLWRLPWKVIVELEAEAPGVLDEIKPANGRFLVVRLLGSAKDYRRIETDVNLRIAEAKSKSYEKRIREAERAKTAVNE